MDDYPFQVKPIADWPGPMSRTRVSSPFSAGLSSTMEALSRELRMLNARNVFMQLAVTHADIRQDGKPYARAKASHPGVILTFDSRHGPLQYAVDRFLTWQDNLRAIALGLESLRRVDRYGIATSGEQYRGWVQIEAVTGGREAAIGLLARIAGVEAKSMSDGASLQWLVREAQKKAHPDAGGDVETFGKVQAAAKMLGVP